MAKEKVTVRVLVATDIDGKRYQPNALVALEAEAAKGLVKDGKADDSKAAVSYVLREGGKVIEHGQAEQAGKQEEAAK